jgi:hypothetical protein
MKIRNKRDVDVVIAPAGAHSGIDVAAGGVVEVDDALGASLLEQSDRWEAVDTSNEKPVKESK